MNQPSTSSRNRRVLAIAGAYGVVAWILAQVAALVFDAFELPGIGLQLLIFVLVAGFPLVVALVWIGWLSPGWLLRLAGQSSDGFVASNRDSGVHTDPHSVAVLPFTDLSPARDHQFFSDGLAEEILGALANVPALKVAGRTSSFAFRNSNLQLQAIGEQLHVSTILEGSVRTHGGRFRINAQLVSAADGFQLWSEVFDRALEDIFAVQRDIALAVTRALQITLTGNETAPVNRGGTDSTDAYMAYLRGRHLYNESTASNENMQQSLSWYEKALSHDPAYADAWAGIGEVWVLMIGHYHVEPSVGWPRVRDAAQKALEIDSGLAEAHMLMGRVQFSHEFDWSGAEASFKRALMLSPGNAEVMGTYSWASPTRARAAEGAMVAREVVARDRHSTVARRRLGFALMLAGEYSEATSVLEALLEDFPGAVTTHIYLGAIRLVQGDIEGACKEFENETHAWYSRIGRAMAAALRGDQELSQSILSGLQGKYGDLLAVQFAWVHAWRGEADRAFDWLERAVDVRDYLLAWIQVDPLLTPLKNDPRFAALVSRLNLPQDHQP